MERSKNKGQETSGEEIPLRLVSVLVICLFVVKSILHLSHAKQSVFPKFMANLLLGRLNQWETVKGDYRVRGREKPGYFLLSHPAWWSILAMVALCGVSCSGQLPG